jgi:putative ubiquitin-RnfH superfamily antitoxin RatB of RatAB toxin-antitoxin module
MTPLNNFLNIEVAVANDIYQAVIPLCVPAECTIEEVLQRSNLFMRFPQLEMDHICVGIFSRKVTLDTKVQEGDRIEIYTPLRLDPKEQRRRRITQEH